MGEDEWLLRSFDGREWRPQYSFATAAAVRQDYAIFSFALARSPGAEAPGGIAAQTTPVLW